MFLLIIWAELQTTTYVRYINLTQAFLILPVLSDIFIRILRAPRVKLFLGIQLLSVKAIVFRYWSDILGTLFPLFAIYQWGFGYTDELDKFWMAFSMLRTIRITSWLTRRFRQRSYLSYDAAVIRMQSAAWVAALSLTIISTYAVSHLPTERSSVLCCGNCIPNSSYEKNEAVKQHTRISFLNTLVTFVSGERSNEESADNATRSVLLLIMIMGGVVFALATQVAPRALDTLVATFPADRWRIDHLKNHFIICGHSQSILYLIKDLAQTPGFIHQRYVFINERGSPPYYEELSLDMEQIYYIEGDFTLTKSLEKAGIKRAAYAVVVADDSRNHPRGDRDTRAVFAALHIEALHGNNIISITERLRSRHSQLLEDRSVEATINRSQISGRALALAAQYPNLINVVRDLFSYVDGVSSLKLEDLEGLKDSELDTIRDSFAKENKVLLGVIVANKLDNSKDEVMEKARTEISSSKLLMGTQLKETDQIC